MNKLTLKQKLFCKHYIGTYGSGVDAVIGAGYRVGSNRRLASSIASENLTKPNILEHLRREFDTAGFNDESIKLQHLFLINQFADLRVKAKAIDMYYKVSGKYSNSKHIDVSISEAGYFKEKYKALSDEDLEERIKQLGS